MGTKGENLFDAQVVIDLKALLAGLVISVTFDHTFMPPNIVSEIPPSEYLGFEVLDITFDPVMGRRRILIHLIRDGSSTIATLDADDYLPVINDSSSMELWPNSSGEEVMINLMSVHLMEIIGAIPAQEPLPEIIQIS
ncbi:MULTISPECIES: hypothetical protein [Acidithrix]|uniref:Uncharacterized protein n=1 Tax=Acidithrix ferrooxidans TaxID=1280514 RepID=A0A0D8HFM4_9ACTN|nr:MULTISPECIES: hypothetical protein [Acidithrix]KJF16728.1 hypothetical protein AXFE_23930 [Acidithrix ferrooxidans]CAG4934336.1 unnamed protein product [Acidithrix sp. C25]